jgi:hypothetical protein
VTDLVIQVPDGRGSFRPLVKYEFCRWFKHRVAMMGLDQTRFHIHGFRHGSLATALLHEPNITLVRLSSNHLSDAIFVYSNIAPEKRFQVTRTMLQVVTAAAAV